MRVHARREQNFQDSASYALKVTPHIIAKYEEFYKVPYPLDKLGNIDFSWMFEKNYKIIKYLRRHYYAQNNFEYRDDYQAKIWRFYIIIKKCLWKSFDAHNSGERNYGNSFEHPSNT